MGAWEADLEQAGAEAALSSNERGASGRARLLGIEVGEDRAFPGYPVDVGRTVPHHATIVGAYIPVADVIPEDDKDIGAATGCLRLCCLSGRSRSQRRRGCQRRACEQDVATT